MSETALQFEHSTENTLQHYLLSAVGQNHKITKQNRNYTVDNTSPLDLRYPPKTWWMKVVACVCLSELSKRQIWRSTTTIRLWHRNLFLSSWPSSFFFINQSNTASNLSLYLLCKSFFAYMWLCANANIVCLWKNGLTCMFSGKQDFCIASTVYRRNSCASSWLPYWKCSAISMCVKKEKKTTNSFQWHHIPL